MIKNNKRMLMERKELLLKELKYYENRIQEVKEDQTIYYDSDGSSDSDSELQILQNKPHTAKELKSKLLALQTALAATQELTDLEILNSEVNILVQDPNFEGEVPVTESGTWHEVFEECKIGNIQFTMKFYVHTPHRKHGPLTYRRLHVALVKQAHELELAKSILPTVTTPSDAFEVLKSYSEATRSRRITLARLAERYGNSLHMEPMPEGGFMLKCADLLNVSWTLQNKKSSIAPFYHRMKFNCDYMDEAYVRIIWEAYNELANPALETDERTLLLAKIVTACLEARGVDPGANQSMDTESETGRNDDTPTVSKQHSGRVLINKDSEVMAPPKSLPKKKQKGKENVHSQRESKHMKTCHNSKSDDNSKVKKAKHNDSKGKSLVKTTQGSGQSSRKTQDSLYIISEDSSGHNFGSKSRTQTSKIPRLVRKS